MEEFEYNPPSQVYSSMFPMGIQFNGSDPAPLRVLRPVQRAPRGRPRPIQAAPSERLLGNKTFDSIPFLSAASRGRGPHQRPPRRAASTHPRPLGSARATARTSVLSFRWRPPRLDQLDQDLPF
jgi:hypothetical protein